MGIDDTRHIDFKLNNIKLNEVKDFDYLGLNIDKNLNFEKHTINLVNNTSFKEGQLHKVRNLVEEEVALEVYKATILPTFDYADYVYSPHKSTQEEKLQMVQNRALRTVYRVKLGKNPKYTTKQMQKMSGCLPLHHRRRIHLLNYAYGLKINQPDIIDRRHLPTRRHDCMRYIYQPAKKLVYRRSLRYRAIADWNNLKKDYVNINS